eukprot:CAMPEP_0114981222 /NCGR_PEP_ID=MMETSP0216-20121206/5419_1 /TAXON_ID=223996 /ORGANISM="Protocruzia adherens, Strain Boccale" /LENGTH=378 /DNA_ID=CAMNT_0002342859 /DNA_START=21 /DNA_END=1158 /DNA_ORIENTATION=+
MDSLQGSRGDAESVGLQNKIWTYTINDGIDFETLDVSIYKPVGHFYEDCAEYASALGIVLHPMLKKRPEFVTVINESQDLGELEEELENQEGNLSPEIMELEILSHKFDYANAKILCAPFFSNSTLKFNGCDLSAKEIEVVVEAICTEGSKVKTICLEYNPLDWNIEENTQAVLKFIAKESPVINLSLRGSGITGHFVEAMLENVKNNTVLKYINFSRAYLDDDDIDHICTLIEESKSLEALDLSHLQFSQASISKFQNIIGKHPFPAEEVDAHVKKEKERDQIVEKNRKSKNTKKPVEEFVPKVDPIENMEDDGWVIWKNPNLRHLNISFNKLGDAAGTLVHHFIKKTKDATITAFNCGLSEREMKKYKKDSRVKVH